MRKSEIAQHGFELAAELEGNAIRYHEKSDSHDVLYWEGLSLRAKSRDLLENCGVKNELMSSALLSPWGAKLASSMPDLANRVSQFHARYDALRSV